MDEQFDAYTTKQLYGLMNYLLAMAAMAHPSQERELTRRADMIAEEIDRRDGYFF